MSHDHILLLSNLNNEASHARLVELGEALATFQHHRKSNVFVTFDPGPVNYAWAVASAKTGIVATGMFDIQLADVTPDGMGDWTCEIDEFMLMWRAVVGVALWERYQTRRTASKNNESANVAIGIAASSVVRSGVRVLPPVMPATWKNWWNRIAARASKGKDPWYDVFHGTSVPFGTKKETIHRLDTCGLATWGIYQHTGTLIPGLPEWVHTHVGK